MKIFYPIIDGEVTGGNMICLRLIEEAKKRGWEVFVNSPTYGDFIDIAEDKCNQVYYIDTGRSFHLNKSFKLARIFKKEKIDLVHSHTSFAGTNLVRIAGALSQTPVISHAHVRDDLNSNPLVHGYQIWLNRITSRFFCDKVIGVSTAVKDEFIQDGTYGDRISVVYNGINLDENNPEKSPDQVRKELGIKDNQKIIGEVGRLCKTKGQHLVLKAAPQVLGHFPNTHFLFVGEDLQHGGAYKDKLISLAKKLEIQDHVIFTGYREDVMDLMRAFDLFVLPSFAEGLPVVVLEAMAAAKPVVATNVGGNEEVVVDGETGTIIQAGDGKALAEAIICHFNNPDRSKQMGQKGYKRVKKHFSEQKMVEQTFKIYEEVLSKRRAL